MKKFIGIVSVYALPLAVFGQVNFDLGNTGSTVTNIGQIITNLIPIAASLAVLFFFWGLAKFILAAGDEGAKDEGKRIMIWGAIALFVMAGIWGIINLLGSTIGVDPNQGGTINVPTIN
jgi:hypothetical protein